MQTTTMSRLLLILMLLTAGCGKEAANEVNESQTTSGDGDSADSTPSADSMGGTGSGATSDNATLDFVPADALFACVIHPHRIFSSNDVAGPWARFRAKMTVHDELFPREFGSLGVLGIELTDLEQVVYIVQHGRVPPQPIAVDGAEPVAVSEKDMGEMMAYGVFKDAFVFRFREAAPREGLLGLLFRSRNVEYAGKTYFGTGHDSPASACYLVDDRTVVFGEEALVRKIMVPSPGDHPIVDQIRSLGSQHDLVAVLNLADAEEPLKRQLASDPATEPVAKILSSAAFALDLSERPSLSATLVGNNAEGAATLEGMLRGLVEQSTKNLPPPAALTSPEFPEEARFVVNLARNAISGLKLENRDNRVELSLGDVVDRSELAGLLDLIVVPPPDESETPVPEILEDENATATIIRQLATSAAGMTNADMQALATSAMTPDPSRLRDQPLTLAVLGEGVLDLNEDDYADRVAEFRFESDRVPHPAELVERMTPTIWLGYCSMLQPRYITKVTCDADDDSATGTIWFDAGVFAGQVQYSASQTQDGWQIDEFLMPARDWRFVRAADGTWQWFDHFGRLEAGRVLPEREIAGVVQRGDEPLDVNKLWFTLEDYPDFTFYAQLADDGKFAVSLPPGRYLVVVGSNDPQVSGDYGRASTTPLIVDVEEDQTELTLQIPSSELP